jgi:hypothetical protein
MSRKNYRSHNKEKVREVETRILLKNVANTKIPMRYGYLFDDWD